MTSPRPRATNHQYAYPNSYPRVPLISHRRVPSLKFSSPPPSEDPTPKMGLETKSEYLSLKKKIKLVSLLSVAESGY